MATTVPSLNTCSLVSLLQVQTTCFLAVKVFSSCTTRNSPSVIWQTMACIMGGPILFDPGCTMMSRIETVLKPGMRDGLSPYARCTTPGHNVVSLPTFVSTGCEAAGFTTAAEATANPMANADLRLTFLIGSLLEVQLYMPTVPRESNAYSVET